jgi:hypothetical protein
MIPQRASEQKMCRAFQMLSIVSVARKAGVGIRSPKHVYGNNGMLTWMIVCTNASVCIAGPTVQLNPGDPTQFEGSCTDRTWNSPACPSFCRQGMY